MMPTELAQEEHEHHASCIEHDLPPSKPDSRPHESQGEGAKGGEETIRHHRACDDDESEYVACSCIESVDQLIHLASRDCNPVRRGEEWKAEAEAVKSCGEGWMP
ncbi:hypothetical protein JCM10207_008107 [Rhodosporidiobolus poonsookiae]